MMGDAEFNKNYASGHWNVFFCFFWQNIIQNKYDEKRWICNDLAELSTEAPSAITTDGQWWWCVEIVLRMPGYAVQ